MSSQEPDYWEIRYSNGEIERIDNNPKGHERLDELRKAAAQSDWVQTHTLEPVYIQKTNAMG